MDEQEFIKYNVTNHALERYAERIMKRDNVTDARIFINDHRNDIIDRIHKMINFGELIYEGELGKYKNNQFFYKDRWIVVVDPKQKNVVTLYRINLGDDEVYELFANKTLQRINDCKEEINNARNEVSNNINIYRNDIDLYKRKIEEYKSIIKGLEDRIIGLNSLIKSENLQIEEKEMKLKDNIEMLIARKVF